MTDRTKQLVIVRGGGDIATGTIHRLHRCGYPVLILETGFPSAIRRCVAFSEAVYDGSAEVEGVACVKVSSYEEACSMMEQGVVPVMIDEQCQVLDKVRPWAVVDAILAKRNLGTSRDMADKTIGLGPGFTAGQDVDLVIETMRGHNLGRIIGNGSAEPNTGIPGIIGGVGAERVIHSPAKGIFLGKTMIGDMVEKGQLIGTVVTGQGEVAVEASLTGLLRGIIKDGFPVVKGFKIADIDPRKSEYENCFTISDKARCIAGSVVEGLMMLEMKQGH
ncbi:EF2563 family selenium-dependent molybdenum hydroxylase system protein [Lachnoclostridium pacaense]|uniref:selenium-dependent molybdenum cofactor biosynthesis protein YqeB n=1 Tax=Enterocloster hominis (ex Hitch et al. 2024) TaxID=1917870 RepID=UPI00058B132C|nr:selenium-dependent molybdenum cofactor biosynthesis protein YqeB [Lachnoclostridium pacaense]MCC2876855.1 EF2563 family selenium-dependent molybdenum hydroxylase system protein [Lachnoclostridium pacaense]